MGARAGVGGPGWEGVGMVAETATGSADMGLHTCASNFAGTERSSPKVPLTTGRPQKASLPAQDTAVAVLVLLHHSMNHSVRCSNSYEGIMARFWTSEFPLAHCLLYAIKFGKHYPKDCQSILSVSPPLFLAEWCFLAQVQV